MLRKHLMRILLVGITVSLVACAPARMVKTEDRQKPNLTTEGIVVFQANRAGSSYTEEELGKSDDLYVVFREEGTQNWFLRSSNQGKPRAFHIKAGRYYIEELQAGDLYIGMPAFEGRPYDPAQDFPIQPFTINAGEAIYLGNLEVKGVGDKGRYSSSDTEVKFVVLDDFSKAKEAMKEAYPEYLQPLKKRLLELGN